MSNPAPKRPLQVGDTIRIYGFDRDYADKVLTRKIVNTNSLVSGLIETDAGEYVHRKQCRRLIKKVRREWWMAHGVKGVWIFVSREAAETWVRSHDMVLQVTHIREVKERK